MKRGAFFGAATIAYLLAAWMVAPGFYDGFTPQQPYNWVCPPPQVGHNVPPLSGHLDIKVIGGVSDANSAFTNDGQIVVGFLPGAFDATGRTTISVDIIPVSPCPQPPGLTLVTNTYLITASAPLAKKANLVLRYSDLVPAPTYVYHATSVNGPWTSTRGGDSAPFTIQTTFSELGYFAAGYPSSTQSSGVRIGGGQVLPIVVAVLIVAVLVAGIPLEVMRRRRGGKQPQEVDDDGEEHDAAR
jgi:hypothetical protein